MGDGASSDRGEQGGGPAGRHPRIEGRRLAVGAHGRARLAWLLGLDRAPAHWSVTSAAWMEDHVEISVAVGGREVVFVLERPGSGEGALVATAELALRHRGKTLPPALARWVKVASERRLPRVTMERIVELLCSDPDLGKQGLPQPASTSRPAQQIDTWGGEGTWAEFFAHGELSRGQLDSIDPTKLFRFIHHCDSECLEVSPSGRAATVSLVNYPWEDRARTLRRRRKGASTTPDDDDEVDQMMASDLDEQDVILGNPRKLHDLLEHVVAQEDPRRRIIFFANTCVPMVTGEDVESAVRQYRKRCAVPLVYLTVTPKAMADVFRDLLVQRRLRAEETAGAPDPRAVNLIGFPDDRATGELTALLGRFGVRVHTLLLPDLDLERLERLAGAALNVFRPNQVWTHYYDQLREGSRIAHVAPPAPFGREATRRWLEEILTALGIAFDDDRFRDASATDDAAWQRAVARAASHRVGLIVRADEAHYLTDPAHTWGVPLLGFAREAGLGLDLMLHARDAASGRALANQISSSLESGPAWTIRVFQSFDDLQALLERAECEAVLSHYFFDWRLTQAGKNAFSLQHFEMGLGGGSRSLERLVRTCEMPFYRRYHRFLQRTREGLRASPGLP